MCEPASNLIWNMTRKCNFRCEYCYFPHDNTPVTQTLPVDRVRAFLDATGREWTVGMTGGEPFIYPGFVDICAALTEGHRIGVDTNLSVSSKVREFARRIDPARVQDLYVALHIQERERVRGVAAFIDNARLLIDSGFKVIVNYVVHPDLEERFKADCDFFATHGIIITPRPFRGEHGGRRYPEAYGDRAHAIFADHPEQGRKIAFNFQGVPCYAGRTLLRMDEDGTVYRCPGDKTVLGNVLGKVCLLEGAQPCVKPRCPCRGLDHVVLDPARRRLVEGVQYAVVGDLDASSAAFAKAMEDAPGHPCAENNLGVLAWRRGDRTGAARRFEAALAARPDKAAYGANLDGARAGAGDFDPEICLDVNPPPVK
ncbi:MAG: radical SAM protein [Pseudodesulfovibrio sp.]|uniref:Radical SAM domain protein n=1 Tax=Pseudodesulfovibrio aespoeensis (strain ATCC 700646 / DSM 10631 / Aspo-2) TaxID=643562 RepID=E6VWC9_PSEA9|nr:MULTISPECIES: radical SAM protein [Pseudodesulfovibrio]MBU4192853.1 radical SAM protein [Pseudomonadota bacterium]ADU61335.1 Radical SAM domain protein [Pseudodesulfovibrio aespoeensis Aspo-2]MBU4243168.1 radical SAM protein [Pseudomonadota bacterium]MBU4378175.1 radical SAM protein [Pseudomonadota bacterium]MBU4475639.1 radical SAM protein [Pseudomonadota bacterium]